MQSRNINQRADMECAIIQTMMITRKNQYVVTGTSYLSDLEKETKHGVLGQESAYVAGPLCVWSTKDLTLVKT
jgi:hypothetical protein